MKWMIQNAKNSLLTSSNDRPHTTIWTKFAKHLFHLFPVCNALLISCLQVKQMEADGNRCVANFFCRTIVSIFHFDPFWIILTWLGYTEVPPSFAKSKTTDSCNFASAGICFACPKTKRDEICLYRCTIISKCEINY